MAKKCINHGGQPAVTMCHQCHKPICKSCTMVTPHGSFCSSECSVIFREFREKMKASAATRKSGYGLEAVVLLLLIIGAFILIHLAARNGVGPLQKIDLVGRILQGTESLRR